jgi:hypothetical protein
MNTLTTVKHPVKKFILEHLRNVEYARFRDLRPPRVETNAFTYHLNALVTEGLVQKAADGYSLGPRGLQYIHYQDKKSGQVGPGVAVMLLVQNSEGDVLLERRTTQPFINSWGLPSSPVLAEDESLLSRVDQMGRNTLGVTGISYTHAGDCYIRVVSEGEALSATLAHLYSFNTDEIEPTDSLVWARPHKLDQYTLSPATAEIMTRGFFRDPYFFEEFTCEWRMPAVDEPRHR